MSEKYKYLRYADVSVSDANPVRIITKKEPKRFGFLIRLTVCAIAFALIFFASRIEAQPVKKAVQLVKAAITMDVNSLINANKKEEFVFVPNEFGKSDLVAQIKELLQNKKNKA